MIKGIEIKKPALQILAELGADFHLTGSRFFETETEGSDWDFYVQAQTDLHKILVAEGFMPVGVSYSDDPLCRQVYIMDNVHVQVVSNAETKRIVQESIQQSGNMLVGMNKKDAQILWRSTILHHFYIMLKSIKPKTMVRFLVDMNDDWSTHAGTVSKVIPGTQRVALTCGKIIHMKDIVGLIG